MAEMFVLAGLMIGFFGIGPVICWLLGMFNPVGYMGHLPWSPEVKAARERENQRLF